MRLRSGKDTQRTRSASPRLEEASQRRASMAQRGGRSKRSIDDVETGSSPSKRVRQERSVSSLPETSRVGVRHGEEEGETLSAGVVEPNMPRQTGPGEERVMPGPSQMGEQPTGLRMREALTAPRPGPSRELPVVQVPESDPVGEYVEIPTVEEVSDFLMHSLPLASSFDNIPMVLVPNEQPEVVPMVTSFSEVLGRDVVFRLYMQNRMQMSIFKLRDDASNLFRCIAYLLYGDETKHQVVREDCMNYIFSNRYYFKNFLLIDVEAYIEKKRQLTAYGSHVELRAMAELYNLPITVYYYNEDGIMHLDACIVKKYTINVPAERQYRNLIDISHPELIQQDAELILSYHAESYYNAVTENKQLASSVALSEEVVSISEV